MDTKYCLQTWREGDYLGNISVHARTILKWILKKQEQGTLTGFNNLAWQQTLCQEQKYFFLQSNETWSSSRFSSWVNIISFIHNHLLLNIQEAETVLFASDTNMLVTSKRIKMPSTIRFQSLWRNCGHGFM